jgi:hypothetical protein
MPRRAVSPLVRGTALAAVAVVALAGCTGDDDGGDLPAFGGSTPSASAAATVTAGATPSEAAAEGRARLVVTGDRPTTAEERAPYDAYVAFWEADVEALADPAKGTAALRKLVVEPQRRRTLVDIEQMRVAGEKSVGTLTITPTVVTVDGRRATLRDCLDETAMSTVDKSGKEIREPGAKRIRVDATLNLVKNAWVVSDLRGGSGSC